MVFVVKGYICRAAIITGMYFGSSHLWEIDQQLTAFEVQAEAFRPPVPQNGRASVCSDTTRQEWPAKMW